MRRLLPFLAILLLAAAYVHTLRGQTRSVHQIAPGVFTRIGDRDARQPANTSWIEFKDFVVAIEANTPWGLRDILPEIRKTTSKPIRHSRTKRRSSSRTTRSRPPVAASAAEAEDDPRGRYPSDLARAPLHSRRGE